MSGVLVALNRGDSVLQSYPLPPPAVAIGQAGSGGGDYCALMTR
jgi:hypothetical protein